MKRDFLLKILIAGLLFQTVFISSVVAQIQDERAFGNKSAGEKRIALVLGNSDYGTSIGKLKNPVNDANDMAEALKRLGFSLVGGKPQFNLNRRQMLEQIREFGSQIKQGGVGLFYFAGHGVQVDRRNYLIPITDSLKYQEDAEFEAIDVDAVLREMEYADNALNILILDACRNNALPKKTRNMKDGLIEPNLKPSGVYIAFAARDGQTASENASGRNGLYTQELLKNIETPNLRLEDIFIKTRVEVKRLSNRIQEPIEYGALDAPFYFLKTEVNSTLVTQSVISIIPFLIPPENIKRAEKIAQLGEELRKKEDCPLAIKNFTEAITLNPDSEYYYSRRGECYRTLGQFNKAIEDFDEAIRRNPQSDFAYASRGVTYWQNGQLDLVLRNLDEALRLNEKFAWAYLNRGSFLQQNGDCGKAVSDLTKAISLLPDNKYGNLEYGYINRSYAYFCQNNVERAISDLNYVLKISPNSIEALDQRISIYFQKKEFTNALADSLRLIKLNPKEAEKYYFLRSQIYWQQMSFSNAIEEFNQVISQNGEMVVIAYGMRGLANGINGNIFQAKEDVNKAIELSKTSEEKIFAYGFRSLYYLAEEEAKKSLADIDLAFKINIDVKETEPLIKSYLFFIRATINSARKKYKLALADVNSAINLNPKMPEYYTLRADIYRQLGKFAEAMADERKSKELIQ